MSLKRNDGTEIPEEEAERFRKFVDSHRWTFAKTYAAFCPHEYTLRRNASWEDFAEFVEFIWRNGFDAWFGKRQQRYFIDSETSWYYFVTKEDVDENGKAVSGEGANNLVNRGSLKQYEFVVNETLFGTEYRVKRLPPEKRGKVY